MNRSKLFTILGVAVLIVGCLMPWMRIEDPSITISGVDTTGTRYGKPAIAHFVFSTCILFGAFVPKVWAKRMNLLFGALNLAWGIRNFGIITACEGGICPEKLLGLYLVLGASIIIMVAVLFPQAPNDVKTTTS